MMRAVAREARSDLLQRSVRHFREGGDKIERFDIY